MSERFKEPRKNREDFETEEEYMTWWKGYCDRFNAFYEVLSDERRKQANEAKVSRVKQAEPEAVMDVVGAPCDIEYLESLDGHVVEVLASGEKYVRIPLIEYLLIKEKAGFPVVFETAPQKPLNHGSFKDLIDDPETLAWYAESQKGYTPIEEVQVETTDELLTWALEHRETDVAHTEYVSYDAYECLPIDDPRRRTIGFFTPEKGVFITLTDLRKSPPSAEVLAKFGPVPVEVLKEAQADPIKLICSYAGRYWLATGRVFDPGREEDLPDSSILYEIWAAEAEQFKMKDEGDLGIPRPLKDR